MSKHGDRVNAPRVSLASILGGKTAEVNGPGGGSGVTARTVGSTSSPQKLAHQSGFGGEYGVGAAA